MGRGGGDIGHLLRLLLDLISFAGVLLAGAGGSRQHSR